MAWITPVCDRNQIDISYAKSLINKIKKSGYNILTQQEQSDWDNGLKACRNASDLNRIENNCAYLISLLGTSLNIKTDWDYSTTPLIKDIQRILNNVYKIKNIANRIKYINTAEVPSTPINNIYKMNDIELILKTIYDTISSSNFKLWSDIDENNQTWDELDSRQITWQNYYEKEN